MSQQEEAEYLQCNICKKVFPKFDQRGFRNAGFTAHQNRCIERDYLANNPVVQDQHPSPPKQRLLLPAPPSASSSTVIYSSTIKRSNSSSPVQQQHQCQQQYQQHRFQQQQQSIHYQEFIHQQQSRQQEQGIVDLSLFNYSANAAPASPASEFTVAGNAPAPQEQQMVVLPPVTQCNYCQPQFGLHQSNCVFLAEFLRQAPM